MGAGGFRSLISSLSSLSRYNPSCCSGIGGGTGGRGHPPGLKVGGWNVTQPPPPGSGRDAPRPLSSMPHLHWDQYILSIPPPPPHVKSPCTASVRRYTILKPKLTLGAYLGYSRELDVEGTAFLTYLPVVTDIKVLLKGVQDT